MPYPRHVRQSLFCIGFAISVAALGFSGCRLADRHDGSSKAKLFEPQTIRLRPIVTAARAHAPANRDHVHLDLAPIIPTIALALPDQRAVRLAPSEAENQTTGDGWVTSVADYRAEMMATDSAYCVAEEQRENQLSEDSIRPKSASIPRYYQICMLSRGWRVGG
jgi:hypothetical protein